jgi:serine/threonine protein kinase
MLLTKERDAEPIAGYRLLEPLGRGGFGEVWKCEAPGGLCKAIKFVAGHDDLDGSPAPAAEELQAIQHVKSLRHPFLLSMERVEVIGRELVIVMELADKNLHDLYQERRAVGQPGIGRDELLGYLREAADVLDLMNLRHGLQHLDVKPGNLFLVSDHVKVADFGLVRSLAERGAGLSLGALSALYAAPELFRGSISSSSDQYSLAIVYQELLTGTLPFAGKSARQLMLLHSTAEPNLSALPEADRPVVARALAKDPAQRFPSCTDFLRALESSGATGGSLSGLPAADTRIDFPGMTTAPVRPAHGQCLPGHQFLSCLGRTPHTEIWEAQTADGRRWLVKFLYGVVGRDPVREKEAVRRLEALRHPALAPLRVVPAGPGCLATVTDHLAESLRDRYQETHGLPRSRLLGWLRPVAEALDELLRQTGLQHLGLTPRSLRFDGDRLRIADFGVLPLLWQPAGQLRGQLQARYAAPELFDKSDAPARDTLVGEACDVYSLAVVFQEMLTGVPPWRGRRAGPPNLAPLTEADRAVLLRALDADPRRRFGSCTELVAALEAAGGAARIASGDGTDGEAAGPAALVAELIVEAGGGSVLVPPELWGPSPRGALQLQHHFAARLPATGARASFEGFRRQWNAQVLREGENSLVLQVPLPGSFWRRWLSARAALGVDLRWTRKAGRTGADLEVRIGAAERCKVDDDLLRQVAPLLLESLRAQLEAHPERRGRKRLAWTQPVRAWFQVDGGGWSEPIDGQGRDISLTGMGLYLPRVLPGPGVRLELTTPTRPEPVELCGHCVRVQRCPDGRYQAGIAFL